MDPTPHTRPAAVAGMFYPGSANALARDLRRMLADGATPAATIAACFSLAVRKT